MGNKARIDALLAKAAEALANGADPFNHEFLVTNKVTADECFTLSEQMALIVQGYLGSPKDEQQLLLLTGASMEMGPDMVAAVRSSFKLSATAKKVGEVADGINKRLDSKGKP